jgi:hypothetical protein
MSQYVLKIHSSVMEIWKCHQSHVSEQIFVLIGIISFAVLWFLVNVRQQIFHGVSYICIIILEGVFEIKMHNFRVL